MDKHNSEDSIMYLSTNLYNKVTYILRYIYWNMNQTDNNHYPAMGLFENYTFNL